EYSLDFVNRRRDCSDFQLAGILRLWYLFKDELPEPLRKGIRKCILNFRYWLDEPGNDVMCFLTENHAILFHSCEYLAGQEFPNEIFSNSGMSGKDHELKALHMIENWMKLHEGRGFIEWYSSTYYPLDLLALLNIHDFCDSSYLRGKSRELLDEIFRQAALATFKGVWAAPQGRAYNRSVMTGIISPMSIIAYLAWGVGAPIGNHMGAVALATSSYRPPQDVLRFLRVEKELYVREKHGGMGWSISGDEHVELTFYKTPDYMLSSVTSHPRGRTPGYLMSSASNHPTGPGYQQHMWQATLGPGSVVFTNHLGEFLESGGARPSFWAGNGFLPRIVQVKNLLLAAYLIPADHPVPFTHAYFPSLAFDEVKTYGKWVFFRKGESYGALWSYVKPILMSSGPTAYKELRAYGRRNVWLCRLSSRREVGDFEEFIRLVKNEPEVNQMTVKYEDFEHGKVCIEWPISRP
ncbi:MAG: hypothetical protein J7L11_02125, partial [Thermoprotei archaeon]|nr:hypothetical protein [Thermoprotei archaeon]